jgi:hypothetical protein
MVFHFFAWDFHNASSDTLSQPGYTNVHIVEEQEFQTAISHCEISKSRGTRSIAMALALADKTNSEISLLGLIRLRSFRFAVRNNEGQMTLLKSNHDFNDCFIGTMEKSR